MVFISPSRLAHLFKMNWGKRSMRGGKRSASTAPVAYSEHFAPLNKIALSVGYSDPVYFTRLFRKHNGIPPGEYRKRYAEMKG